MAPRVSATTTKTLEEYGFEFAAPPEKSATRLSKHDDMWKAARDVAMAYPGNPLRVRQYNTSASAYNDAKSINNAEHRHFPDGKQWTAVAAKTVDAESGEVVFGDTEKPLFDLYITFNGE